MKKMLVVLLVLLSSVLWAQDNAVSIVVDDLLNLDFKGMDGALSISHRIDEHGSRIRLAVTYMNISERPEGALEAYNAQSAGLYASYIYQLGEYIIHPYCGLGIGYKFSYGFNEEIFDGSIHRIEFFIPLGVEYMITENFAFFIENKFSLSNTFVAAVDADSVAFGILQPQAGFTVWF